MSRLEEIKARREAYDNCRPEDYSCGDEFYDVSCCGNDTTQENWCKGRLANDLFWDNLEDDEAWLIEEVDRLQRVLCATERLAEGSCDRIAELQTELAKFKPCGMGFCSAHQVGLDYRKAYHKEQS